MSLLWAFFSYDCGVMVLKYMELWDGVPKFDHSSTMPEYTSVCFSFITFIYVLVSLLRHAFIY